MTEELDQTIGARTDRDKRQDGKQHREWARPRVRRLSGRKSGGKMIPGEETMTPHGTTAGPS